MYVFIPTILFFVNITCSAFVGFTDSSYVLYIEDIPISSMVLHHISIIPSVAL